MEKKEEIHKETVFDSSVATLQRIDTLMNALHNCELERLGSIINCHRNMAYLGLINRLWKEGHVKFSKEEKDSCNDFRIKIDELKVSAGKKLFQVMINGRLNSQYRIAWNEIIQYADAYENYVIESMDKHGMLMKTSKDAMQKFREG